MLEPGRYLASWPRNSTRVAARTGSGLPRSASSARQASMLATSPSRQYANAPDRRGRGDLVEQRAHLVPPPRQGQAEGGQHGGGEHHPRDPQHGPDATAGGHAATPVGSWGCGWACWSSRCWRRCPAAPGGTRGSWPARSPRRRRPGAAVTGWTAWHRRRAAGPDAGRTRPAPAAAAAPRPGRGLGARASAPAPRRADVVHAPTPLAPPRRRTPLVVTVHDAVPWTHPETLTPRGVALAPARGRARAARHADRDRGARPPRSPPSWPRPCRRCAPDRVVVVGEGVTADAAPAAGGRRPRGPPGSACPTAYLLSLATLEPRKGLDVLLAALAEPKAPDLPLLLVGQPGWGGVDPVGRGAAARAAGRPGPGARPAAGRRPRGGAAPGRRAGRARAGPRGSGCRCWRRWPPACPVVTSDAPALVEVGGGAARGRARDDPAALAAALADVGRPEPAGRSGRRPGGTGPATTPGPRPRASCGAVLRPGDMSPRTASRRRRAYAVQRGADGASAVRSTTDRADRRSRFVSGRAPRVLVDATAVPADRGGVGRYVDGLISALGAAGADFAVVCQRADAERYSRMAPARDDRARTGRDRAPAGPAGLGADRPAAGRPAGRRRRAALAALHDAAARRPAGRRDHPRRDLLHPARRAHLGQGHRSSGPRHDRAAPRGPLRRAVEGDPGRAGPGARRRPDPDRRGLPRGRPGRPSTCPTRRRAGSGCRRGSACAAAVRRLPRHARAAQERAVAWSAAGCKAVQDRRRAAGAGAGRRVRLGRRDRRRRSPRCRATCACCGRATCASPTCPATSAARPWWPTRATARASACRCWRRWPAARRC